jgi:hypothetical protein
MAYSQTTDLLLGEIPVPSYINTQKVVDDAADEIDSKLGHIYTTPFNVTDPGPMSRPARLLLKRINNFLATGRLILAVASPEENQTLHAYGWSLIREATTALDAIINGDIPLEGAQVVTGTSLPVSTPLINNLDSESNVEAFYDRIANPNYFYPPPVSGWSDPDKLVL